jgi:hypothetical protein
VAGWLLIALTVYTLQAPPRFPAVDWATVTVEREAFMEGPPGQYTTAGIFDGVGMVYFSVTRRVIQFKGFRRITLPHLGQQQGQNFEICIESFTIQSLIRSGNTEYAFEAVSDGPFGRSVTGKLTFAIAKSGLVGTVSDFRLEEHGQIIKGIMNRYSIAKSRPAQDMLRKYSEIFLGGNYVALDPAR